jgi:hypothetical protein
MLWRRDPYAQFKNFVPEKNYNNIVKSRATKTNKLRNLYRVAQNRYVKQQEQLYREMKEAFGITLRPRLLRAVTKKGQQKLLENKLRKDPERAAKKVIDMLSVFPVAPPCPVLEPKERAKVSTFRVLTRKANSRKMLPKTSNSVTPKEPSPTRQNRQNQQNQLFNAVSQRTRAKTKSKK